MQPLLLPCFHLVGVRHWVQILTVSVATLTVSEFVHLIYPDVQRFWVENGWFGVVMAVLSDAPSYRGHTSVAMARTIQGISRV